jgi:hypothetical protein
VSISRRLRAPLPVLLALLLVVSLLPASAGAVPGPSDAGDDRIPGQILVKFKNDAPGWAAAQARRLAAAEELSVIDQLGVHVWRVPEHASARALQGLQRNAHVEYAELDAVVELAEVAPNDPWFRHQWGLSNTRSPDAWSINTGSRQTTIAVLDTGLTPSAEFTGKVLPGHNVLDGSSDVTDLNGHGTSAASVAAAVTDNATGIAGYCWACQLLPVKVMGSTGTMSDVAKGVIWATDHGADVISMSLGGSSGSSAMLSAARYAADRGVLLAAAAGNSGSSSPFYPAAYPEVISVAGSTSSDTLYAWSNHGSWVDVSAPGEHQSVSNDGNVWGFAGTSSATPAVAGILGLALSLDGSPSAAEVRGALNEGAVPIGSGVQYGRVDALNTLRLLEKDGTAPSPDPEPESEPVAPEVTIATPTPGDSVTGELTIAGSARSEDEASIAQVEIRVGDVTTAATGTTSWSATVDVSGWPEGTTRITATATTSSGASTSVTLEVTVEHPEPEPDTVEEPAPGSDDGSEPLYELEVTTRKVRGQNVASLQWSTSIGQQVSVIRDGRLIATVEGGGTFEDASGTRGSPTFVYQVCGTDACTPEVAASW